MVPAFAADEPLCVPEPVEEKYRIAMAHLSLIQGKPELSGRPAFSRLAQRNSPSKNDCARRADLLALKARSYDPLPVFPPAQKEAFYLTQSRRFHSASFQSVIAAVSPMSIGRICRMAVHHSSFRADSKQAMCGRYAITLPPEAVRQWFQTYGQIANWPVYYNAAPTAALPVVRQNKAERLP
jgi:hypothetical protein